MLRTSRRGILGLILSEAAATASSCADDGRDATPRGRAPRACALGQRARCSFSCLS
jgi:hypothetical protein